MIAINSALDRWCSSVSIGEKRSEFTGFRVCFVRLFITSNVLSHCLLFGVPAPEERYQTGRAETLRHSALRRHRCPDPAHRHHHCQNPLRRLPRQVNPNNNLDHCFACHSISTRSICGERSATTPATDGSAYHDFVLTEKGRALVPVQVALGLRGCGTRDFRFVETKSGY